jgi:hypothetical protein
MIAYIDPGTGGVILQLAIAAVVGAGFYFRRAVKRLVNLLLGRSPEKENVPPSDKPGNQP